MTFFFDKIQLYLNPYRKCDLSQKTGAQKLLIKMATIHASIFRLVSL